MFMSSVPWTIFYKYRSPSASRVLVANVSAPSGVPLSAEYYNMKRGTWEHSSGEDCVIIVGAIRGHHAVTAHIPGGYDYSETA